MKIPLPLSWTALLASALAAAACGLDGSGLGAFDNGGASGLGGHPSSSGASSGAAGSTGASSGASVSGATHTSGSSAGGSGAGSSGTASSGASSGGSASSAASSSGSANNAGSTSGSGLDASGGGDSAATPKPSNDSGGIDSSTDDGPSSVVDSSVGKGTMMDAEVDSGGDEQPASDAADDAGVLSFASDVYPILVLRCIECHTPHGSGVNNGRLDLTTGLAAGAYDQLMMNAMGLNPGGAGLRCSMSGLTRVVPGSSATSLLFNKVESKLAGIAAQCGNPMPNPFATMPLTPGQVTTIRDWIDQGAAP